jgi:stage III sporulation protein AG
MDKMSFLKNFFEKFFKNGEGQDKTKRSIQNLSIFLIIGIAMVLVSGVFSKSDNALIKSDANKGEQKEISYDRGYLDDYDALMENKIKNILTQMQGVGKVSIAITYASSKEIVPAEDVKQNESNTNERDNEGGARNTTQIDTDSKIIIGQQESAAPVILKTLPPEIRGVVVVADGAKNENVKVNIAKAVSTALGISLSKIQVFPMAN